MRYSRSLAAMVLAVAVILIGLIGRRSSPDEQAWPLIFLNSPRSSYVAGDGFMVDGGFLGAVTTGASDALLPSDLAD